MSHYLSKSLICVFFYQESRNRWLPTATTRTTMPTTTATTTQPIRKSRVQSNVERAQVTRNKCIQNKRCVSYIDCKKEGA